MWTQKRLRIRSNTLERSMPAPEHSSTWHFWLPQADSPKCLFYQEIMITIVTAPVRPYHLHFNLSNHGNLAAGTMWWFRSQRWRQRSENSQPSQTDPGENEKMFAVHCDCLCQDLPGKLCCYLFIYLFCNIRAKVSRSISHRICRSYIIWRNLDAATCSNLL